MNRNKTLIYWVAPCNCDTQAYAIRAKTEKQVKYDVKHSDTPEAYDAPRKVTVKYSDALDLLCQCMGEGSIYEAGPS